MTMPIRTAFDLDGVLVDFVTAWDQVLYTLYNVRIDMEHDQYRIRTYPEMLPQNLIQKSVLETCTSRGLIEPYPKAHQSLLTAYFLCQSRPVRIVTARPVESATETHLLIRSFTDIPYELVFSKSSKKINYLYDQDVFVEDRRRTAISISKAGKYCYLIDKPYNRIKNASIHSNIDRVYSLPELNFKLFQHDKYHEWAA
jgi:hypothetical protein